jgi:hypothetical protein
MPPTLKKKQREFKNLGRVKKKKKKRMAKIISLFLFFF